MSHMDEGLKGRERALAAFLNRTRDEWGRRAALEGLAGPKKTSVEFATERLGIADRTHYYKKRDGERPWEAEEILALAAVSYRRESGCFSMAEMFDQLLPPDEFEAAEDPKKPKRPKRDVHWRMGVPTRGRMNVRPGQLATDGALRGLAVDDVLEEAVVGMRDFRRRDEFLMPNEAAASRRAAALKLVHGALDFGLVELLPVEREGGGFAAEDDALAGELCERLTADLAPRGIDCPEIRVVRRMAHSSFGPTDPLTARLIALLAHKEVAGYLGRHSDASSLGVMGGFMCAQFCRAVGESSPFPDASVLDARRYHLFPLTVEPFEEQENLANSLVGELTARARALLGLRRVVGHSVSGFDLLIDRQISTGVRPGVQLRRQFQGLDVALIGCGALRRGDWLDRAMLQLTGGERPAEAIADVGLNLLDIDGNPVPLPSPDQRRWELLGISVPELRLLVQQRRKVVLMTHGRVKGLSLVAAARAGVCSTIITDADCADAAIEVLDLLRQKKTMTDINAELDRWHHEADEPDAVVARMTQGAAKP